CTWSNATRASTRTRSITSSPSTIRRRSPGSGPPHGRCIGWSAGSRCSSTHATRGITRCTAFWPERARGTRRSKFTFRAAERSNEESHMARHQHSRVALGILIVLGVLGLIRGSVVQTRPVDQIPTFELDPSWPKPLPNNWGFGEAWGIAVDSRDHPWVPHSTNHKNPAIRELLAKDGKRLAPPVIEFDAQGNVVQAWGGPGPGHDWPEGEPWAEHGMF